MILSHINAEHIQEIYKKKFEMEIELNCLNFHFMSKEELERNLEKYKFLKNSLLNSVLKESEFHVPEAPYYEMSIYLNKEDFLKTKEEIESHGCVIDLIHLDGDSFTLEEYEN